MDAEHTAGDAVHGQAAKNQNRNGFPRQAVDAQIDDERGNQVIQVRWTGTRKYRALKNNQKKTDNQMIAVNHDSPGRSSDAGSETTKTSSRVSKSTYGVTETF